MEIHFKDLRSGELRFEIFRLTVDLKEICVDNLKGDMYFKLEDYPDVSSLRWPEVQDPPESTHTINNCLDCKPEHFQFEVTSNVKAVLGLYRIPCALGPICRFRKEEIEAELLQCCPSTYAGYPKPATNLPLEVIQRVAGVLESYRDVCSISSTCKYLYDFIMKKGFWGEYVKKTLGPSLVQGETDRDVIVGGYKYLLRSYSIWQRRKNFVRESVGALSSNEEVWNAAVSLVPLGEARYIILNWTRQPSQPSDPFLVFYRPDSISVKMKMLYSMQLPFLIRSCPVQKDFLILHKIPFRTLKSVIEDHYNSIQS
eukprot:TRINITY_DN3000_c0_g1_i1.p1 TRINITY_DN3000_c0_g1~~TRINITY_DN3000_c0_g1_i1.p1  ORF type:complete len:335 (+),score=32.46 TRINITY_DN3000_c0_g1_i1:69-1007(+)